LQTEEEKNIIIRTIINIKERKNTQQTAKINMTPSIEDIKIDHGGVDVVVSSSSPEEETLEFLPPKIPVDRQWISKLLQKYPNPNSRRHDKALVVAPMVDQSELPFRLLCRKYGANFCYTPMMHAGLIATNPGYRNKFLGTWPTEDRPLIAQICGSDLQQVLYTAKLIEPHVDGIDINCGCPQQIAKKGHYGAFLLEQEDTLLRLVKYLLGHLTVPLSVKVRLLPSPERNGPTNFDIPTESLRLYQKLVDAGVHLLTIHGRTRKQKGVSTGHSDWVTIGKAVEMFKDRIPIFANGSIETYDDVEECLRITNAEGVMSSESLLEYPPIFYRIPQTPRRTVGRLQLAKEYMEYAKQYPPNKGGQGNGLGTIKIHLHRFLHRDLQEDFVLRKQLVDTWSMDGLADCIDECEQKQRNESHVVGDEKLSWYRRWRDPPPSVKRYLPKQEIEDDGDILDEDDGVDLFGCDDCGGGGNDSNAGDY
jgi:tRNA-dihydrouridine synthase 1